MAVPVNFFQREKAAVFPGKPGFLVAGMDAPAVAVRGVATLGVINPPLAEGGLTGETTPPPPVDVAVVTTGVVMVVLVVVAKWNF